MNSVSGLHRCPATLIAGGSDQGKTTIPGDQAQSRSLLWKGCAILSMVLAAGVSSHFPWQQASTILIFAIAVAAWTLTEIEESYVALCAASALVLCGSIDPGELFQTLGDSTSWLMINSFVIAAALQATGMSQDWTWKLAAKAKTVQQLLIFLSIAIFITAFLIPATSARAALVLPVYAALRERLDSPRISRALALLIPTVVLLSAFASLTGAGAHLVTADLLAQQTGIRIGYLQWIWYGFPFAFLSCAAAVATILYFFLDRDERTRELSLPPPGQAKPHRARSYTLIVVSSVIALWCTEPLHGIPPAATSLMGALLVTAPQYGAISLKKALKEVEWGLLLFLAGTTVLGQALFHVSGIEGWFASASPEALAGSSVTMIVLAVACLSLLAHLAIHSRTARSTVLIPLVTALGASLGVNAIPLALLSTAAAGYCLTLPVCAKPVALFSNAEESFSAADLLKLSALLLPVHLALLLVCAFVVWPLMGLSL